MSDLLAVAAGGLAAGALASAVIARCRLASRMEAVAQACHELRGPLTAARLGLEPGFRFGPLPDARLRAIELELERATLALHDLSVVSQSRGHRRARTQPLTARAEWVNVGELLADSVEAWRAAAAKRGVELRLYGRASPLHVIGERVRLAQATGNLIANAIEHGSGPVDVTFGHERGRARIEVADAGPGLPAPMAELAPRRGVTRGRFGLGSAPRFRGHGLGVAIGIAAAHGGRLAAAPSDGGAKLVLELPAAEPASSTASADI